MPNCARLLVIKLQRSHKHWHRYQFGFHIFPTQRSFMLWPTQNSLKKHAQYKCLNSSYLLSSKKFARFPAQKLKLVQKLKLHFSDASESQRAKATCTTLKISSEIKSKNCIALYNYWFSISTFTNMRASELHLVSLMVHLTAVISHNRIPSSSNLVTTVVLLL